MKLLIDCVQVCREESCFFILLFCCLVLQDAKIVPAKTRSNRKEPNFHWKRQQSTSPLQRTSQQDSTCKYKGTTYHVHNYKINYVILTMLLNLTQTIFLS